MVGTRSKTAKVATSSKKAAANAAAPSKLAKKAATKKTPASAKPAARAAKSTPAKKTAAKASEPAKPAAKAATKRSAAAKKEAAGPSAKKGHVLAEAVDPAALAPPTDTARTPPPATSASSAKPLKAEVVFSFDTTVSMYPCLTQVRRQVKECVERLFQEIGPENLRIGITAHGDYCSSEIYVTKHLPLTTNVDAIVEFVENVKATYSYTKPEAYEL
ncbi:von Willebrand factor type A, partial [Aphelenchoides avenae]